MRSELNQIGWRTHLPPLFSAAVAVLMLILKLPYAVMVLWLAVIFTLISGVDYFVRR